MTDRLSGPIMEGKVAADEIGGQAWAIYATSCWGGMELRENWGTPPVIASMGDMAPKPPFADLQQGIVQQMTERMEAIRGGGEACLRALPAILREPGTSSPIHGVGYNAGVQVVKTAAPPGPKQAFTPAAARCASGRDFLRVDYDMTTPQYLKEWRSAFERTVIPPPTSGSSPATGRPTCEIWKAAVAFGNQTWGGDSRRMTDQYWEETIRWSLV
jgi:hypothetical protein